MVDTGFQSTVISLNVAQNRKADEISRKIFSDTEQTSFAPYMKKVGKMIQAS